MGRMNRSVSAFSLLLVILALVAVGQVLLSSAVGAVGQSSGLLSRQLLATGIGLAAMAFLALLDYDHWARHGPVIYGAAILALVTVLAAGTSAKGAQRWLDLGPLGQIQPSEPAKVMVLLLTARLLSRSAHLAWVALAAALPALLTALQPDLGTAVIFVCVTLVQVFLAGYSGAYILGFCALGVAGAPWILRDYQKERLLLFLNPEQDPSGAGYNLIQSQIALGSGEVWGKGLYQGELHRLNFLPESHTDFIFAVLGEEFGLVGCLSLLALYTLLIAFALVASDRARDDFGRLVAGGLAAYFAIQIWVNAGMAMGLMPITGLPLPFLSYGGSAQLTNLAAAGLLLSIYSRRRVQPEAELPTLHLAPRLPRPEGSG